MPKIIKSQAYIKNYEKPKLVEYFTKLSSDLPWDELAECLKIKDTKEKQLKLAEMYDNGTLPAIRSAVLSQIQSCKVHAGKDLEMKVKKALETIGIPHASQVYVKDNKIIAKRVKGCFIVDFIVPEPIPDHDLKDYTIISTKTSTRERSSQDNHFVCKQMIKLTHDISKETDDQFLFIKRNENEVQEQDDLIEKLVNLKLSDKIDVTDKPTTKKASSSKEDIKVKTAPTSKDENNVIEHQKLTKHSVTKNAVK